MRVAKQGSKGEGGRGFHHLFDWNLKPNKKVVSKIANLSVQPQQKASVDTNMQITQYHPVIEDYTTSSLILKGCTSSLIDEDDNGKSPGVVARLMGLDSFPTSNSFDTKSNRFFDTRSRPDSSALHVGKVSELEQKDNRQVEQKRNIIEKFQTESLLPKSARSVIITQHKLVSTIKSSGFVSLNNPTRIMEAVSKIPLVGSTSVDVSNRKLSPTRPVESTAARKLKGQSMNKSWDGCLEQKDGKKSVSLAIQAKVNVKKREGFTLNGAKSANNQPVGEKNTLKKPATNKVLKPNNKKQNCVPDRVKSPAKSSVSSTNTISRSTDMINQNSLSSATGGGSLSTLLDQPLRELTAMSPALAYHESRITRTIIFQDKRNQDGTSKDAQVAGQEFGAVFSTILTKTEADPDSSGNESEHVYIKNILSDIESMFKDFTLNRTSKIVNRHLFDQLEAQKPVFDKKHESCLTG